MALNVPLPKPRRDSNPHRPLRHCGALSVELLGLAQSTAIRPALLGVSQERVSVSPLGLAVSALWRGA